VPEEEDRFFKRGILSQCVYVEALVAQDAGITVDVTDLGFCRNDAFKPCACCNCHELLPW
jgi:hypothetical protein